MARRANSNPARLRVVRPAPQRGRGRPLAADSQETEAKILRAAQRCFARDGFDKTTNQAIAESAGISAGTIYHYFPSKPALYVAVGESVGKTFFDRFGEMTAHGSSPFVDQMRSLVGLVRTLSAEDPSLVAFMASWPIEVSRHSEIRELAGGDGLTDAIGVYRQRARSALEQRQLRRGTDAGAVAAMITSLLLGLAALVQAGHSTDLVGPGCDAFERLIAGELFA